MRVISGSARGIPLETLEGLETRPTTDRVKEAIFSMIQNKIYGSVCLDLFSGSGALGIELLSRGAQSVLFVEKNPKSKLVIERNLVKTKLNEGATLLNRDVYDYIENNGEKKFDLILMDPPYLMGHIKMCLESIERYDLLTEEGLVIVEHAIEDQEIIFDSEYFESLKTKKYGKIGVTVLRRRI
ncbi:16S rRNA (guanine(966)-N(2))-methyltransferase RsmD [Fusibacter bizertensis]